MDIGSTCHVCIDQNLFSSYHPVDNGEEIFMGNSSTSKVVGKGKVILKMTPARNLLCMMCCMCQIFVRILFLADCWVRMVSNWSLNLTSLCSQRMACTWERVIWAMGYSKLIWFGLDPAFAFTIGFWGFFCFNYYIFWSNAATIYVLFIKQ